MRRAEFTSCYGNAGRFPSPTPWPLTTFRRGAGSRVRFSPRSPRGLSRGMKLSLAHGSEPRAPGRTPTAARRARRRGVAAVELAILAPFLGVLVMGMFEMGRLVMVKDILTDSVRKGGRTGATPGKT